MVAVDPIAQLRQLLGESLEPGGKEEDSLFSDLEIQGFLDGAGGDPERAAYDGWRAKAAALANLVDVTDGAASRALGSLLDNAQTMVKLYARSSSGSTEGRTRVGRIRRTGEPR